MQLKKYRANLKYIILLSLAVFLLAGTAGGFVAGFCWRKLFCPPTSAIVSEANEGGLRRTRRSEAQAGENKK